MDKYKQYVDVQWWNGIDKRDIENWIKNFGTSEMLAELILDNVIFYNVQQMKAYTRFLVNKLKEEVYERVMKENGYIYQDDSVLSDNWDKYMLETNYMPAALSNDPTSSAYKVLGYWRSILGNGNDSVSTVSNIQDSYKKGIRRFVLVDDFSGSGEQMLKVLRQKIEFKGKQIELGKLSENFENIEIVVAVYVIHEKARKILSENYSKIKVLYVDLINDDLNYLNVNSSMYEKYETSIKQDIVKQIQLINEKIMNSNEELQKLYSYILNIPVVFEHGCPNNTLLLLFAHTDNWQQLFKRGKEI